MTSDTIQLSVIPASAAGLPMRRASGKRRGAAVVEFAIVWPLLFMMTIAVIELGQAMLIYNVLTSAARAGARVGTQPNASSSNVIDAVEDALSHPVSVPLDAVTIQVLVNGVLVDAYRAETEDAVTVLVQAQFQEASWLRIPFLLSGVQLTGRAVMRRE